MNKVGKLSGTSLGNDDLSGTSADARASYIPAPETTALHFRADA
jgi:hypothetical protein